MFDTLVRGAELVTPEGIEPKSVVLQDGKVAVVAAPGETIEAREEIDATGKLVMPGLVDAHVHLREPGFEHKEDFVSGTMAAAAGGVTTVMDMPTDDPWTADAAEFEHKRDLLKGRAYVDVALQAAVGPRNKDIEALAALGAISFEIFLAGGRPEFQVDEDSEFRDILYAIKGVGGVAGITAGDSGLIAKLSEEIKASGRRDIAAFNAVRPPLSEVTGVERACAMAVETGARIHFRQISCGDSAHVLKRFAGHDSISSEVTPHNLLLTDEDAARLGPFGAVIPPLRSEAECEALRSALRDGIIQMVATDHAPHLPAEKERGRDDIWQVAPGLPGLQTFAAVMLELANRGALTLQDIARTCAERPARQFGLYPRKGAIAVGSDADLMIVDPNAIVNITDADQLSKAGWTPFAGQTTQGCIERVMLRGQTICLDGKVTGSPKGVFLRP
jgi:dihydroorotase